MQLDENFPLEAFPSPVRAAILDEFDGRCPTVREVAYIPDNRWLATPAIGPATLERIRCLTQGRQPRERGSLASHMTDAELMKRLLSLQEELRSIHKAVEAKMARRLRDRDRAQPN